MLISDRPPAYNPNSTIAVAQQALESDRPENAFEIEIITRVDKSAPPLRGRVSLPRDVRKKEEVVLVFAEGDLAELARNAGASFVGGEELCQQVRPSLFFSIVSAVSTSELTSDIHVQPRSCPVKSPRPKSSPPLPSYRPSPPRSDDS